MTRQALLEQIERRIKIVGGHQPRVALSLQDWRLIEDMILELSAPKLLKSIEKARRDYKNGKVIKYKPRSR